MSQTLSQIKALLRNHGLRPKKRLGQNFLHDGNQMARIVSAAQLEPGEPVLEVGPGTGNLSLRLLERGVKLLAVEADRDLKPILEQVLPLGCEERVLLIMGDILAGKHQLNSAVLQAMGTTSFKLVANLPYNVASPLLANLVADYPMRLAVVTVQHEVAQRLCAGPGTKSYGPLGVLVQAMCEVEPISHLSPSCFWPAPEVESMVLRLKRRDRPLTEQPHRLAKLTHRLFNQRRKQIGSILGRADELPAGINSSARPEQLEVEQLITLAQRVG